MATIIGQDTLNDLAEKVTAFHKPIQFNWFAKFGLSPWQPSSEPQATLQQAAPRAVTPKPAPKETWDNIPAGEAKKPSRSLSVGHAGGGVLQCRGILLVQQAAVWREYLLYGLSEEGLNVPREGGTSMRVCHIT